MTIGALEVVMGFWVVLVLLSAISLIRMQLVLYTLDKWDEKVFSLGNGDWQLPLKELRTLSELEMIFKFWRRTSWFIRDKPLLKALMEKKNDPRS